jgi:hypothetical protein
MSWQKFAPLTRNRLDKRYCILPRMSALRFPNLFQIHKNQCNVNMMLSLSWLDCTMPHDRVYAARHLLKSDAIMALVPDYSLPIEQLFSAATAILLQEQPNCSDEHPSILLAVARLSKESQDATVLASWPTWVPEYHNMRPQLERCLLQYNQHYYRPNFKVSDTRMHVKSSFSNWKTIQVKGRSFSTIDTVLKESVLPRMINHHIGDLVCNLDYGLRLYSWYHRCRTFVHNIAGGAARSIFRGLFNCGRDGRAAKLGNDYHRITGNQDGGIPIVPGWSESLFLPIEVFDLEGASVLQEQNAANGITIPSGLISPPRDELSADKVELRWPDIVLLPVSSFKNLPTSDIETYLVSSEEELPQGVFDVIVELQSTLGPIWRWEFEPRMEEWRVLCSFKTARGIRFGWVPSESRPNDELCYFSGAPFPFVVRKVDDSDARVLIGDAWVYDVLEWDARLPDSVRQEYMASLWPHPTKIPRPLLAIFMERQAVRDVRDLRQIMNMVEQWEEANMGWITLQ